MEKLKMQDWELELFEDDDMTEEQILPWQIEDLEGADWVFKKIKFIEEEIQEHEQYVKIQIEKYKAHLNLFAEGKEKELDFWKNKLQTYLQAEQEKNPKFKINTAMGTANFRKSKKWNWKDEEVLQFLEKNELEDFIRVKREVDKVNLKKQLTVSEDGKVVTEDGEILEGVTVKEEVSLVVKTK